LYSRQNASELNKQLTQDWAVRYWISKGCSPSKLVMGLALYGRSFRLANSNDNQIGAPVVGAGLILSFVFLYSIKIYLGSAGLFTGEGGFLAYYEICTRVQQQNWTKVFDEEQKSNYAYKGQEWVGYDDIYSIGLKVY
jgi:chitinase